MAKLLGIILIAFAVTGCTTVPRICRSRPMSAERLRQMSLASLDAHYLRLEEDRLKAERAHDYQVKRYFYIAKPFQRIDGKMLSAADREELSLRYSTGSLIYESVLTWLVIRTWDRWGELKERPLPAELQCEDPFTALNLADQDLDTLRTMQRSYRAQVEGDISLGSQKSIDPSHAREQSWQDFLEESRLHLAEECLNLRYEILRLRAEADFLAQLRVQYERRLQLSPHDPIHNAK